MSDTWNRATHLRRLSEDGPFDVLIVGGGVTGCGAAVDLADRGLRVALVEQEDFAHGTSGRSTKLFHGGIRYLPHLDLHLVAEGLREQKVLARIADFLYHPLRFVIPLYRDRGLADAPRWFARGRRAPLALRAGLVLYDLLGGPGRPGERHRRLDAAETLRRVPGLRPDGLVGGFAYSDAQTDDARLVVTLAKTAVYRGDAVAVGRVRARRLRRDGDGYVAQLEDRESASLFEVRAGAVLAATGAFDLPGVDAAAPHLRLVRSKGVHIITERSRLGIGDDAVVLPETEDGRVLFVIPWLDHAMVGTTDTPYDGDPAHPRPDPEDIDYLIRHVVDYLDVAPFTPLAAFAGLRALADTKAGSTARASREHLIAEPAPGYVAVAGGKLTTYRRIAAEASDRVAAHLGVRRPGRTDRIGLVGSGSALEPLRSGLVRLGVAASVASAVTGRYGAETARILEIMRDRPETIRPLGGGVVAAEVVYAARHEAATTVADVALRRTHLGWFSADHGRGAAPTVAGLLGDELGWSDVQRRRAIAAYEEELAAEGL